MTPGAALVALLLVGGCAETPTDGFERFYEALADGDAEAASQRLTARARAQLAEANAARGFSVADALAATFPKSTVRSLRVVEGAGDSAIVELTDALGARTRVSMRREGGRWHVDLDGGSP